MIYLSKHTYAAEVGGALIFLDLKRNSYTYVAPNDAAAILPMFSDTLLQNPMDTEHRVFEGSILDELKLAGLIVSGESERPFKPRGYSTVANEQPRLIGADRPKVRWAHVWNFIRSVVLARALLSCLPLHLIAAFVDSRRTRRAKTVTAYSAAQLTEVYRRLRPLLFSRNDRCLLDSLSLINFLRQYHVRASWCFGVKLEPFKAHAWVQDDNTIFDDMAANVHSYTVILEV